MTTPQSEATFLRALKVELTDAREQAKKLRDNAHDEGYADGYLDGLKWVPEYFFGPWDGEP